jgi:hypothetical protein
MVTLPRASGAMPRYAAPEDLVTTATRIDAPIDPVQAAERRRDRRRSDLALDGAAGHDHAYVVAPRVAGGSPTLVLVQRPEPYDLADVASLAPTAFDRLEDGALVLRHSLALAPGTTLVVDSERVPALYLASGPGGYVDLLSVRSTLRFVGHPDRPLTVGSYDPTTGARDDRPEDGRAYVLARGGEMWAEHTTFQDLGFAADSGTVSGVTWAGSGGAAPRGGAVDATFRRNHVGVYTAGARGLVFRRVAFLDNVLYGFDPHTDTDRTLVEDSVAAGNGRHGIIFSDACSHNVVRDTEVYRNGGSGFVVDDGSTDHGLGRTSDGNTFERVSAHDNGAAGIVIEGGVGNEVRDSVVDNNEFGVWVRNQATGTVVAGNEVTASRWSAIRLDAGLGDTVVAGNDVAGARNGIAVAGGSRVTVRDNWLRGVTGDAMPVEGDQARVAVVDLVVTEAGRGLTLDLVLHRAVIVSWILILLLPLVSCASVAGGRSTRRRRSGAIA